MKNYEYIIIGGGMTGSAAVMGIRRNDTVNSIAMFTDEQYEPYNRPPLTKGLWNGMQIEDIIRPIEKYHVDLHLETNVNQINPEEKTILTNKGDSFHYEKLLLATGAGRFTFRMCQKTSSFTALEPTTIRLRNCRSPRIIFV